MKRFQIEFGGAGKARNPIVTGLMSIAALVLGGIVAMFSLVAIAVIFAALLCGGFVFWLILRYKLRKLRVPAHRSQSTHPDPQREWPPFFDNSGFTRDTAPRPGKSARKGHTIDGEAHQVDE